MFSQHLVQRCEQVHAMHWEEGACWALGFSSPGGFPKSVVLTGGEGCGAGGPGMLGESGAAWVGLEDSCAMSCPQVVLRIRPLNDAELEEGATVIAHKVGDQVRLWAQGVSTGCSIAFPTTLPLRGSLPHVFIQEMLPWSRLGQSLGRRGPPSPSLFLGGVGGKGETVMSLGPVLRRRKRHP